MILSRHTQHGPLHPRKANQLKDQSQVNLQGRRMQHLKWNAVHCNVCFLTYITMYSIEVEGLSGAGVQTGQSRHLSSSVGVSCPSESRKFPTPTQMMSRTTYACPEPLALLAQSMDRAQGSSLSVLHELHAWAGRGLLCEAARGLLCEKGRRFRV